MRTHIALAAVTCVLLSVTAAAQDGLRSASLPEHGPSSTVTPERDLFLVPPDFYNQRPDPGPARLFFPHPLSTFVTVPYPYLYPYFPQYDYARVPTKVDGRPEARPAPREAISAIPALPNVTLPASLPGKPKTFYVIPGCYAGDRSPEPAWLPAGCDSSKIRIIPPD
jgi:hypothetical protein